MKDAFLRLRSGSDVRGVAVATPDDPATLTEAVGSALGAAFAYWLARGHGVATDALTVAVGRDSRVSGEALAAAMARGLASRGVRVLDCGLCTTPAMFMTTVLHGADGAVMVTASHLPWRRNGYKFFTPAGGLDGADIEALLAAAADIPPVYAAAQVEAIDFLAEYAEYLRDKVRAALPGGRPLDGLHIVVDAGNGAGGFYADLLASMGADATGSQFLAPDGHFPNHPPNPEDRAAMAAVSAATVQAGADLGVIFDADCDRAALVGADGREINRNRLIALVAAVLLRETPGITVVTDSVVSAGLGRFIAARGGHLHRFKRGYRNVIDEAIRLNAVGVDCPLAIETSGHAALRENHFLDDGMYLVTRLIIEAKRGPLTDLIAALDEPAESAEVRLTIGADDFRAVGAACIGAVVAAAEAAPGQRVDPDNREGVRIEYGSPDEWLLLRLSLHDPLLVINAESARAGGVAAMLSSLEAILRDYPQVDLTPLLARINLA